MHFQFIISVVILALAVCSDAGYLPAAVVDVSHGAWGAPWAAAPWGGPAPYWGAPAAHGYPWGQPSLTTSHSWGAPYAWGGPYAAHGPTTAYHADPSPHGHDG